MGPVGLTLHYHGTPITPKAAFYQLGGRCFCVSFADPRDVKACHEIGQSVMLDNGAFTFWNTKRQPDWDAYYEWVEPWLDYWTTWAIIPDVIDGDEADNDSLVDTWPFGEAGAPVWHMHESLERLDRLCSRWPRVCIGSSGDYKTVANSIWHERMHEIFDHLCEPHHAPPAWIHMLRGMGVSGGPYPFASVDSTNIARNHKGSWRQEPVLAHTMANRHDIVQCPAVWIPAADRAVA